MPDTHTTCGAVIAQALHEAGVRHVFGHPGGETVEFMEALTTHGVEFILTGHESAAAFMAGTVGRLTGAPGACLATLGPGACNLVLGVGCAYLDRDPLLAFSARTATGRMRLSNKQNLRLNDLFAPIAKWSVALDGAGTAQAIRSAVRVATAPPKGPVYLSMPSDVAAGPDRPDDPPLEAPALPGPDDRAFDAVAGALNAAQRPVAVVGCALDPVRDAAAVRRFFEATRLPYCDTPQAKGVADEHGGGFLGTVSPGAGDTHIIEWLKRSDCILGVGFDPVESAQGWHLDVPFYGVANGPTGFDQYRPPAECVGDVTGLLDRLRDAYRGCPAWTAAEVDALRRRIADAITPSTSSTANGLSPYHLITALRTVLPGETVVAADVGAHKHVIVQAWRAPQPHTFLISNGLSAMGYAVPAAMAAALIHPRHPVVCVTGDAAFAMMVQELETVRRMGIAPLFVVLCDASLALIKVGQQIRGLPALGVDFMPVEWARVAEGFGVRGETAATITGVERAVAGWLSRREPMVLAVKVDETLYRGIRY